MNKALVGAVIIGFLLTGCAGGFKIKPRDDWSTWDKALCTTATVTAYGDAYSTDKAIKSHESVYETNLLMSSHPSTTEIYLFKTAVAGGTYLMANNVDPQWRKVICGFMSFFQGGATIHNLRLADKMENK
jgi:hypothetical protein